MSAPAKILDLVDLFRRNADAYRSGGYNETQVRQEFINPFFKALGWDMDNEQGHAEAYKDVIHEDAIKVGGATKAPDYCFRIGGTRKFFLEAKRPSVNLKDDPAPAYQLRRYAWSAKLPLSVLTDFEEFAVYDCRVKPAQTDKASAARTLYFTYPDYGDRWDDIAGIFSREAILKGSFDKYAETAKVKRGTATVDTAFLQEIESWRAMLAVNLALRNKKLSQRELNYAVQATLDRIIFLRMCEDRGIEKYGQLQAILEEPPVYEQLKELFRKADDRYNSGLFYFHKEKGRDEPPDELTPGLAVDDKPLREIIKSLYYPESPYEFSVLPAEILGQVYEQFLGKVIRLTAGHQAKVEDKPEVKKAGGVYYTPAYIVDYIVEHTVGKLVEDKTPRQVAKLRVLDPACGSGSFLLGAFQYLINWHRDWYTTDGPEKHPKEVYQGPGGGWRLTTAEKKRILLNNIYGVDIDPQAVEVTKLSLLLKVLEGESSDSLDRQRLLFHERALPDLSGNIKCGNSLIGPDFYDGQQMTMFDEEERYRINVFDWKAAFPAIMKAGGFDAVIGNPPYVRMETFKPIKDYLRIRYEAHEERADLYAYFIEQGTNLLRPTGRFGMIVSNKFIKAKYGKPLRSVLKKRTTIDLIADFAGADVFHGATVRTIVLLAQPKLDGTQPATRYVPVPDPPTLASLAAGRIHPKDYTAARAYDLSLAALGISEWYLNPASQTDLIDRLRANSQPLADWLGANALFGLKTGFNDAFIVDNATKRAITGKDPASAALLKPILFGRDVRRYFINPADRYVIYCHPDIEIDDFPGVRDYLTPHRALLLKRAGGQKWYELQQPATALIPLNAGPKIVYPIIANECRFALDTEQFYINDKLFILPTEDAALLALLNSRLANFYFASVCAALEGGNDRYLEFRAQYVDRFPVSKRFSDWSKRALLASCAAQMGALNRPSAASITPHDRTGLKRQIAGMDRQIDRLVYELYGLTEEEIRIVEGEGTPKADDEG